MPQLASRLLVVTDRHQTMGRPLGMVLEQAARAGPFAVQVRERDLSGGALLAIARELAAWSTRDAHPLLINDRIDVALAVERAGVHLRSDSFPLTVARRLLGPDRLLGISVHSVEEAMKADAEGADYIIFGPLYETPSKAAFGPPLGLRRLEEACKLVQRPIVGIGGITVDRVRDVCAAGAFGVAVISAILSAADVKRRTHELLNALSRAHESRDARA
ncbi:putative thiamine-phosphate synthase [Nitrospira sp. KM1]|uniref:thiamine phosphate synthase n=1 Tax=Nitrospira sp. KM1 TaxID=1936990 RepID=UPI0013A76BF7|nr:thiamine phosphate synthase [Nitrospira sp. KM1]BCA54279.1 putative thiamine-phosphate synthase [Nitrospira sp. KM1]